MEHSNTTPTKIPILDTGKFKQWKFSIQQYLQNEHYALWEVIEFGDSYEAPKDSAAIGSASDGKKGRTVAVTTEDMQKRSNNVKTAQELWAAILNTFSGNEATRKTKKNQLNQQSRNFKAEGKETLEQIFNRLQAIVSHLEFMDVEIEQDDLNQKFLTSLAPEWLMYMIMWRNRGDLDTMSLDDIYNHLKNNSGNGEVNTASISTASTQVSPASANVAPASINLDTACAYIASQSNGSQIKFEDINQIDEDDIKEIDIKWNMALLSMRADRYWKKTGKKISIQGTDMAGFDKLKVECFNCHKMGHFARECRAPRSQERIRRENYIQEENHDLVADEEAPIEFSLMAKSSSDNEVFDNSLCSKACKKNTDSLNSKITELSKKLGDTKNMLYHYKLGLSQTLKKEKEGIDSKLTGSLTASKDLDNLIGSQKSDKNKEDDTITDYTRPSPSVESNPNDLQNNSSSLSKIGESTGSILSKHEIKFVKAADSPTVIKTNKDETVRKTSIKYAKMYRKTSKRPFQRKSAGITQSRVPRVATVNARVPTVNRKFPTVNRNFPAGNSNFSTPDLGNKGKAIKASAYWIWRPTYNTTNKGYWDSGCSRYMTGNISYLSDYEAFDGGYVSFGQGGCNITSKGTIKTDKLKFKNVYFMKDLKYNLFSVSQIYDNKNSVLFTDSKCIMLGRNLKLTNEANVFLRTPRQHNIYSIDLNNVVPHNDLTCLVAKASTDESMLWHRRLGHLNFKTMNRLVRHNLVRGLPSKCFDNDHTCVACLKGKQHKASCNTKLVNSMTKPHHTLHMVLFGPTSDETSGILRNFITEIENLKDVKFHDAHMESSTSNAQDACNADAPESSGYSNPTATSTNPSTDHMETLAVETRIPSVSSPVPTACLNDSPELSNILRVTTSTNDSNGVETDLDNMEYNISASPTPTFRIHKDHLKSQKIGPVDTPVQTKTKSKEMEKQSFIATIHQKTNPALLQFCLFSCFLSQEEPKKISDALKDLSWPLGFQDPEFPARVYKVEKAILANTPMDKGNPWGKDGTGKDIDLHLYRSMIGSLMYLTASRPDIMFAVYSDYGGATQDRKSTTGGCQVLGRRLISWQCKKQTIMATSTTKVEQAMRGYVKGNHIIYTTFFWSTAWIKTMDEGTKILATIDGKPKTISKSSIRRNLKLRDEAGISSLPDAELFQKLTLMGYNILPNQKFYFQKGQFSHQWKYLIHTIMQCLSPKSTGFNEFSSNISTALVCLATNRVYNFSKMIFDGMVRNVNNKVSKFLMYPKFFSKCLKMSQIGLITHSHTYTVPFHTRKIFTTLRVNSPSFSGWTVPLFESMLVTMGEGSRIPTEPHHTPSLEAQQTSPTATSSPLLPPITIAPFPMLYPLISLNLSNTPEALGLLKTEQDKANITKTSALPSDLTPRVTSLAGDEGSMQQQLTELTDLCTCLQRQLTEMVSKIAAQDLEISQLKARVKLLEDRDGGGIAQSRENALINERSLDEGEEEEVTTVSVPPATISVSTGSDVVPTGSPIFTTATVCTPYSKRKGKEKMVESETPKKKKLQEQMDVKMATQLEEEMETDVQRMNEQIAKDAEIARIHAEEELQIMIDGLDRNNETVAKQLCKSSQVPDSTKKATVKEATERVLYVSTEESCRLESKALQGDDTGRNKR
uniref:CCHC-type domain-containing protein n=2 Tax=Tanacetum cinerariifolium TaxID=118510 RepID=A0A6L2KTB4_TANCI|nr:hypothetical protein [Tanacetum cinerariifolium]